MPLDIVKESKHCFIESERLCTVKYNSAYKSEDDIYCSIILAVKELDYFSKGIVKRKKKE